MSTPTTGNHSALVAAYLNGDDTAITIIDVAVNVATAISAARAADEREDDYEEMRQECDEALDWLAEHLDKARSNGWIEHD